MSKIPPKWIMGKEQDRAAAILKTCPIRCAPKVAAGGQSVAKVAASKGLLVECEVSSDIGDYLPLVQQCVRALLRRYGAPAGVEADDIVQQVMLALPRGLQKFDARRGASVKTYLRRVIDRRAVDVLRRLWPREMQFPENRERRERAEFRVQNEGADEERGEKLELVLERLATLSRAQREAVELVFDRGFTKTEAAKILNISLASLQNRLAAACRRLRGETRTTPRRAATTTHAKPQAAAKPALPAATRYGLGAVTSREVAVAACRALFLWAAERAYPEFKGELRRLAAEISGEVCDDYHMLSEPAAAAVDAYCRRWGLVNGKEPADWARQVVARTCYYLTRGIGDDWALGAAYSRGCNDVSEVRWDAHLVDYEAIKGRTPRRLWPKLRAALRAELAAGGLRRTRSAINPLALRWTVEHYCGGRTYSSIAADHRTKPGTVKAEVTELSRLIGLRRPAGRPRKPTH